MPRSAGHSSIGKVPIQRTIDRLLGRRMRVAGLSSLRLTFLLASLSFVAAKQPFSFARVCDSEPIFEG